MTMGKAAGLTAGFVAAVALGIAIGPSVRHSWSHSESAPSAVVQTESTPDTAPASAPEKKPSMTARAKPRAAAPKAAEAPRAAMDTSATVALTEPKLHAKLKPVLNPGARMDVAAQGFKSAEQFAMVAHAARNTSVPFMVLKHRVVDEGRSLADALHQVKPELDAKAEVDKARAAAKADLDAVRS